MSINYLMLIIKHELSLGLGFLENRISFLNLSLGFEVTPLSHVLILYYQ
jgi:hypothetical protein